MTTCPQPSTGLALSLLVPQRVRQALNWRVMLDGRQECGSDTLFVQVGPSSPYRLLVMCSGADGLVNLQLWQVGKTLKVLVNERVLAELVEYSLEKMVRHLTT